MPVAQLQSIAEECGLMLKTQCSLGDWMLSCTSDAELMSLRHVLKVVGEHSPNRNVSVEEWEAIQLYVVAIWEKI